MMTNQDVGPQIYQTSQQVKNKVTRGELISNSSPSQQLKTLRA